MNLLLGLLGRKHILCPLGLSLELSGANMWSLTEGNAGEGFTERLGETEFLDQIMHKNRTTPKLVI